MISFEGTVPSKDEITAILAAFDRLAEDDNMWRRAMRESILECFERS